MLIPWGHYLEWANHKILIQCYHKNLKNSQTTAVLSWQQATLVEILHLYDFFIDHMEVQQNPVDGPLRSPNYEISCERTIASLMVTTAAMTISESYGDLLPEIKTAKMMHLSATKEWTNLVHESIAEQSQLRSIQGALTCERRRYMPVALHSGVTDHFIDPPKSIHFGALITAMLEWWDFCMPTIESEIWMQLATCKLCPRIWALHYARYGLNMSHSSPSRAWEGLTVDLFTDRPQTMLSECLEMLVIVGWLTYMVFWLLCSKDDDNAEQEWLFIEHMIGKHGGLDIIISNHWKEFISWYWDTVCCHNCISHQLSTALHPQMNGQRKQETQLIELLLRAFCKYE